MARGKTLYSVANPKTWFGAVLRKVGAACSKGNFISSLAEAQVTARTSLAEIWSSLKDESYTPFATFSFDGVLGLALDSMAQALGRWSLLYPALPALKTSKDLSVQRIQRHEPPSWCWRAEARALNKALQSETSMKMHVLAFMQKTGSIIVQVQCSGSRCSRFFFLIRTRRSPRSHLVLSRRREGVV